MWIEVTMVEARTLFEVDAAFQKVGAESHRAVLMMLPTTTRDAQQSELADLATRNRLPVLYNMQGRVIDPFWSAVSRFFPARRCLRVSRNQTSKGAADRCGLAAALPPDALPQQRKSRQGADSHNDRRRASFPLWGLKCRFENVLSTHSIAPSHDQLPLQLGQG